MEEKNRDWGENGAAEWWSRAAKERLDRKKRRKMGKLETRWLGAEEGFSGRGKEVMVSVIRLCVCMSNMHTHNIILVIFCMYLYILWKSKLSVAQEVEQVVHSGTGSSCPHVDLSLSKNPQPDYKAIMYECVCEWKEYWMKIILYRTVYATQLCTTQPI